MGYAGRRLRGGGPAATGDRPADRGHSQPINELVLVTRNAKDLEGLGVDVLNPWSSRG